MNTTDLVVSGLGVTTPWSDDPRRAAQGAPGAGQTDPGWFDVARQLGPRGYRYLPPACGYLLAATRRAVAEAGGLERVPEDERALVVATNHAATGVLDGMDEAVADQGAQALSPALAPYFSINTYAGRVTTEFATKGFAVTLTSPAVAGFEALALGSNSVLRGRASALLVGATEAALPAGHRAAGLGEAGAAVLVLEPAGSAHRRGAAVRGTVRAASLAVPSGPAARELLAAALARLLGDDGPALGAVHLVADGSPVAEQVGRELARYGEVRTEALGAGCLAPMLRLVEALASAGGPHLVVVAGSTGRVALAVVGAGEAAA